MSCLVRNLFFFPFVYYITTNTFFIGTSTALPKTTAPSLVSSHPHVQFRVERGFFWVRHPDTHQGSSEPTISRQSVTPSVSSQTARKGPGLFTMFRSKTPAQPRLETRWYVFFFFF